MAEGWYPLTREIYVINTEPRVGLATGFAAFLASERGQRIILKSGILPNTQPYRIIEVKDHF
jgi:phosphate transport system substrate-binding protein